MRFDRTHRVVGALLVSDFISQLGSSIASFALMWWVYEHTGSPLKMGMVSFSALIAFLVFGPIVGPWVDKRENKKHLLIFVDLVSGLAVAILGWLVFEEWGHLVLYYGLVVLKTVCELPIGPCRRAILKEVVAQEKIPRFGALSVMSLRAPTFIGPVIGGILIAYSHVGMALFIDALSFFLAAGLRFLIPSSLRVVSASPQGEKTTRKRQGWGPLIRYTWNKSFLRRIFLFVGSVQLFTGGFGAVLIVFVQRELHQGADILGLIQSIISGILLLGTGLLAVWKPSPRRQCALLYPLAAGMGMGIMGMGLVPLLAGVFVAAFFVGSTDALLNSAVESAFITEIDADKMGRVSVLFSLLGRSLAPLSVFLASMAMEQWGGARPILQIMGLGVLGTSLSFLLVSRGKRVPMPTPEDP